MTVQLVIPMSGLGSRFLAAGYTAPKPLIEVHGQPMIAWVLRMFPGAVAPLFICRNEHLAQTPMRAVLEALAPDGRIIGIEGAKTGPVAALLAAAGHIDDTAPVMVSYCDYFMHWDYAAFLSDMAAGGFDGAVPCYTGFHPHLLPAGNLYASCRLGPDGLLAEIREKHCFEPDKTRGLHSPGAYYFGSGALMKQHCAGLVARGEALGGEFYVSMVYNAMVAQGLRIAVPTGIAHFCQWGTPADLHEYLWWQAAVRRRTAA